MLATFVRYEGDSWILYLRYGRLLVYVASYQTRADALAAASTLDGLPA